MHTKGVVPQRNGKKETFWSFQKNFRQHSWVSCNHVLTCQQIHRFDCELISSTEGKHYHSLPILLWLHRPNSWKGWTLGASMAIFSVGTQVSSSAHKNDNTHITDGWILWITMCLRSLEISWLALKDGWITSIQVHQKTYLTRYKRDIESHLRLMTAANINVQPIAHHIIMQLASWNVAPFTQAINSISYQALSTGWDWIKVLAKKQRGSKTTSCFSISGNRWIWVCDFTHQNKGTKPYQ